MKSYRDLEIYQKGMLLFFETHKMSLLLPKYELYELGSQIRRSSDSIVTNIVEGYGRKRYKSDFVKFLVYSHASNLETLNHLEKIQILYPEQTPNLSVLISEYDRLGAMIYSFIKYVEEHWNKF
jgi:four helix bundle protein